ncbi:PucR family transcriptional regulator ligand-binding domain-containing protein [Microlunatus panaciterrae]|uniref:PucR family transcriptional regulator n=1 Tax=Microlunatus panaciterrae TaxID=400768 RepID=A0ABS2RFP7_9ACTN|nr:PucR family transcriptional regulator [Microlunatus panaciterrae]MBM7797825.1 hypothetical protein [Microlunatus panaciterrae]
MRLGEVVAAPGLRIKTLYCDPDMMAREVRWVYTTDLLHPQRYLRPGQLVLTQMMWRRKAADSEVFVAALAEAGTTALMAGDSLYGYVPEDLVAACRRHHLPLFSVPADVSFAAVTAHVSQALAGARLARLQASLRRHLELLTDVHQGRMLNELVERTAAQMGQQLWIVTATGRQVATSQGLLAADDLELVTERAVGASSDRFQVTITDGSRLSGFLVAGPDDHRATAWFLFVSGQRDSWDPVVTEMAQELSVVAGLYRARDLGQLLGWADTTERLVKLLDADSDPTEIGVYLRQAGLRPDQKLVVAIAEIVDRPDLRDVARWVLADAVAHHAQPLVGVDAQGRAVVVMPAEVEGQADPEEASSVDRLAAALRRVGPGLVPDLLRVGTSRPVSVVDLGGAYRFAQYGMQLAGQQGGSGVALSAGEDVSTAARLLLTVPGELRRQFVESVLGRLLQYDARYGGQLLPTLSAYLETGCSWVRTAELTHVHLNTVRYRIARIEELTDRDTGVTADRADLYLALKLI